MSNRKETPELPTSYSTLPFTQILISHVPPTSPKPTEILIVTLHRPDKHNAFTDTMASELERAFGLFDVDDRVKCIVLTGHGRIFCAGADLEGSFTRDMSIRTSEHRDGGGRVVLAIHSCRKPTIAALQGPAVGVGITMTLPCAIRLAVRSSKIGFVFARRGLVMEACSSFFLPRLIGFSRAMHLITTGSTYPAEHKLLEGLFSEVLDTPEQALSKALQIAGEVVKNCSVVSWALMRDLMWRGRDSAEGQHLLDSRVLWDMFGTKDNLEGVKSFLEKRPVNFTGTMDKDAPTVWPWWVPVKTDSRITLVEKGSKL